MWIDGCSRNHHRLLHGSEVLAETGPMTTLPCVDDRRRPEVPREGAPAVTLTSCNAKTLTESYSLRTVPVWMKANGRKVKINAILDDASNETFLNEEVAGVLGLQLKNLFRKFKFMLSTIQWKPFSPCR